MPFLILVSCIWAFSFGIIGNVLAPVPSALTCAIRMVLSLLVFLPFIRPVPWRQAAGFMALGAVQFGGMYLAYIESFKTLASHQVSLLTITTPVWVALLEGCHTRRFAPALWGATLLATAGAACFAWQPGGPAGTAPLIGVVLVQISNLCFALGQWLYRGRMNTLATRGAAPADRVAFAWMYLGAALATGLAALPHAAAVRGLTGGQWAALAYLGVAASGLCFFLWNLGARRVAVARLAVMNDLKIPLGVLASLVIFREAPDVPRLACGALLLGAGVWLGGRK